MNKFISIFLLLMVSLVTIKTFAAKPILNIVPDLTSVSYGTSGQFTVRYTVTNTTKETLKKFNIYPSYNIENKNVQNALSVSLNTCVSLAPSASCTFRIIITGNANLPSSFIISPRVCAENKLACSEPTASNRVVASLSANPLIGFAYVTSDDFSPILFCDVQADGSIINCQTTATAIDTADAIVIDRDSTFAYISNFGDSKIYRCTITATGALIDCAETATGSVWGVPAAITLNPANTFAYISDVNYVRKCNIENGGGLNNCTQQGTFPVSNKLGSAITPLNTFFYSSNLNNNSVTYCQIANGGVLNACSTQLGFSSPAGIAINGQGNFLYAVENFGSIAVTKCTINPDGSLSPCTHTSQPDIEQNSGIALNAANTFAYFLTGNSSEGILKCALDSNGDIGTCSPTGTCIASNPNCFPNFTFGIALS